MTNFKIPTESEFIEADGTRYAYRKFGTQDGIPVVFLVHFRGTMENWDPNMLEPIANTRPVIFLTIKGLVRPMANTNTITEMAKDAATFIKALGLEQVDHSWFFHWWHGCTRVSFTRRRFSKKNYYGRYFA